MSTPSKDGLTPGDRREMRALVKRRFALLRQDVKRRETEMTAEVQARLAEKYREDERLIADMNSELDKARADYQLATQEIMARYRDLLPGWTLERNHLGAVQSMASTRSQERQALLSAIPAQVTDAMASLDRQEMELLERLTLGGLETEEAKAFIASIPTVAALIPATRMRELEAAFEAGDLDA